MRVVIYGIGGLYDDGQLVGIATDPLTALSLVRLVRATGGRGVSLHGPLFSGAVPYSGEATLETAEELFKKAQDDWAERELIDMSRPY